MLCKLCVLLRYVPLEKILFDDDVIVQMPEGLEADVKGQGQDICAQEIMMTHRLRTPTNTPNTKRATA